MLGLVRIGRGTCGQAGAPASLISKPMGVSWV
ncbi:hypothetical protein ACRB68_14520 [Actinomadura sp. RB68]|uniref:Uncharacterized protein n=1 Tax=Actinomadura macrotermitis TaxID=2585200 RepID=A0A7K0BQF5_9ACTN|nr:hypothetical protein [Actinomadura macrotermitis]